MAKLPSLQELKEKAQRGISSALPKLSGLAGPGAQYVADREYRQNINRNFINPVVQGARSGFRMAPPVNLVRTLSGRVAPKESMSDIASFAKGVGALTLGPFGYLTSGLLGGTISKATGGSFEEGVDEGISAGQQFGGLARATTPLISSGVNRFAPQLGASRLSQGVLNTVEGLGMDQVADSPTTLGSMALDFGAGLISPQFNAPNVNRIDKGAILTNDQAKRAGRILKEFEMSGKLSRDAYADAWKLLTDETGKVRSKKDRVELNRADDKTVYSAIKNLMTQNQEYVFKDLAPAFAGKQPTQASKGVTNQIEYARNILKNNTFTEAELKGLQGLDPKYNPHRLPPEVWKQASKEVGFNPKNLVEATDGKFYLKENVVEAKETKLSTSLATQGKQELPVIPKHQPSLPQKSNLQTESSRAYNNIVSQQPTQASKGVGDGNIGNIVKTENLLPEGRVTPQLPSGPFFVKTAAQARKLLKKFPGINVQVDNTLKGSDDIIVTRPPDGSLKMTTLDELEEALFGSATPTREALEQEGNVLQRTSERLKFTPKITREIQERASSVVGQFVQHPNPIVRNTGRLLQGFAGGLGKSSEQVMRKGEFRGQVDYATELGANVQTHVYNMVENNKKSLERIHAIFDPEKADINIKFEDLTPNEKEAYKFLTMVSDFINDTNYKNGFISEENWLKNKGGGYIARAYEEFDFAPEIADFIKQAQGKADLNPFKKRLDAELTKDLKSIKDPAYLLGKRLQQTLYNDAVLEMAGWMKNTDLVSDTAKPGFVKLSDHRGYGELAGKYIRKDALEDIKGFFYTHDAAQKAYDLLSWYDRNPVRQGYKKIFTVLNPAVQLGNNTANFVFAWLNGINPVTFAKNQTEAIKLMKNNDGLVRRMKKDGLLGTDLHKADIQRMAEELKVGVTDKGVLKKIDDTVTGIYRGADDMAKVAAMKTWLDRGVGYEEAAKRVFNGFQNYRTVGWLYDVGAKMPVLGNPFVRFQADLVRIMKNAAMEHPFRVAGTLMAWKLFTDVMSRHVSNEAPEDRKVREERVGAPHIPFTNISLAVQTPWGEVNAARLIGTYAYNDFEGSSVIDDISRMGPILNPAEAENFGSAPDIGPFISLAVDKDFRGKSIADPDQNRYTGSLATEGEKLKNRAKYLARQYTPTAINNVLDVRSAIRGEEDFYGRTRTPGQAALRAFPGIKTEVFGPEQAQEARNKDVFFSNRKIDSLEKNISTVRNQLGRGEITQDQAIARVAKLQQEIDREKESYIGSQKYDPQFDDIRTSGLINLYKLDKYTQAPPADEVEAARWENDRWSDVMQMYRDDALDKETKNALVTQLGMDKDEVGYYDIASDDTDVRRAYINKQLKGKEDVMESLALLRIEVNDKRILTNNLIDDLEDEGVISDAQAKYLKSLKWKNGELTRGGGGAKIPKINMPALKLPARSKSTYGTNVTGIKLSDVKIDPIKTPRLEL